MSPLGYCALAQHPLQESCLTLSLYGENLEALAYFKFSFKPKFIHFKIWSMLAMLENHNPLGTFTNRNKILHQTLVL